MVELNEIYKCAICGNIVEVVHASMGELVCCGQPMNLMEANADDKASKEKHVPIVKHIKDDKFIIKIGSIPHPMEESHYIEWIEVVKKDGLIRKSLKPGDLPEKEFTIRQKEFTVRIYCNLHGLWKK